MRLYLKIQDEETIKYSEEVTWFDKSLAFQDMNLSRPLLKVRRFSFY